MKHNQIHSSRFHRKSGIDFFSHQPGTMPGTLKIDLATLPPKIVLIDYNSVDYLYKEIQTPDECETYLDTESVSWVDVQGIGNEKIMQKLGEIFKLHPLILEDVVNVPERPKVEDYDNQLIIIARMVTAKERKVGFYSEQVSFILGNSYLLTIQEEPEHDCFESVRLRIRNKKGSIRHHKADYLAYSLLDAIIDSFFPILEAYGEEIDELEEEVVLKPTHRTLQKIYRIRRELLALRRAIWPQRDAINSLIRDGSPLISEDVRVYLRDCYDHTVQVMDIVETYRELTSGLMDVYLSAVGNRMNEIMKLLTVISSIFIPLTFIAGIYGMNFNTEKSPFNMPELNWYWGYPVVLSMMMMIALVMIIFFWRRGWFHNIYPVKRN